MNYEDELAKIRRIGNYDDHQIWAKLTVCADCYKAFYMTEPKPICVACQRKRDERKPDDAT